MGRKKRHHVIPQFYLRGFSENEKIGVLDLQKQEIRLGNVADVAVESDYFSLQSDQGVNYEDFLAVRESAAAAALHKVKSGTWPLDRNSIRDIAEFVIQLHLRVRSKRQVYTEIKAGIIKLLVSGAGREGVRSWIENAESAAISDARLDWEIAQLTSKGGVLLSHDPAQHVSMMEQLVPEVLSLLVSARPTLITFHRKSLIVSDNPVLLYPRADQAFELGVGMKTAGGWLIPLSRRQAIQFDLVSGISDQPVLPGSTWLANTLNQQFARTARRFIYAHPEDVKLLEKIEMDQRDREIENTFDIGGFTSPLQSYEEARVAAYDDKPALSISLQDLPWPIPGRQQNWPGS